MTARKLVVAIGGPAYQGIVRTEHCSHVANIAANLYSAGFDVRFLYQSNTLVGEARAELLTRSIDTGVDVLLSIDSDIWGPIGDCGPVWQAAFSLVAMASLNPALDMETARNYWSDDETRAAVASGVLSNAAIVAMVCAQKDHQLAVWSSPDKRMAVGEWSSPMRRCWASGLGYAFFNVGWYRRRREMARRFDTVVDGMSEDVYHCRHVHEYGDGAIYTALGTTYHKSWGSDEVLVIAPEVDVVLP